MISGDTSDGYHTFNELYEHRHILFFALLSENKDKAWRSKLHDDGSFLDGWFIAGLKTDSGQATYHLPLRMWDLFDNIKEVERAPKWDGHTSEDVLIRIREMALHHHKQEPPPIDIEEITGIAWEVFFSSNKPAPYNQMKDVIRHLASAGYLRTPLPRIEGALEKLLRQFSIQNLSSEMYEEAFDRADFQSAYDTFINKTRAYLKASGV